MRDCELRQDGSIDTTTHLFSSWQASFYANANFYWCCGQCFGRCCYPWMLSNKLQWFLNLLWIFLCMYLLNNASFAAPQIPLCRRMLGSKPGQLRFRHWLTDALIHLGYISSTTRLHLIHTRLHLIHTRLHLIHTRLHLIHTRLHHIHTRLHLIDTRLHLIHTRLHLIHTRLPHPHSATSHPHSASSNPPRLHLIHSRLHLIHSRLHFIHLGNISSHLVLIIKSTLSYL